MPALLPTNVQRLAPNGISVLISGAGIGGLAAALEVWRKGCNVRILDRSKETVTTGDSIALQASGLRMFKKWPEMQARMEGIAYRPLIALCKQNGERFQGPMEMAELVGLHAGGAKKSQNSEVWQFSRPQLHEVLLEQLHKIGVGVEYGRPVQDYFEDATRGKAGVTVEGGSRFEADVVVAADGVRGKSWGLIAGKPVPARSSGSSIFRAAYPVSLAMQDPVVEERFALGEGGRTIFELWHGPDMSATFWRSDRHMMWSITHLDTGTAEESWSNRITPETALDFTSTIPDWPDVANRVIRATPADSLVDWKLMWRDPQPKWTSPAGRVVQLGDAAHSFLPSSASGAVTAIEDAVSLATCLSIAGKDKIPEATRVHNLLRFERVSFLQALGVARREGRNTAKKGSKQPVPGSWLTEHDAESYAHENYEQAVSHLRDGIAFKNTNRPANVEYIPWTMDSLVQALDDGLPSILDGDWS